ncbi:MAG: hypothetical protein IJR35_06885 [Synergistaceae bacterium]|nr:hypothetical protein [Synergistaceae bacterium]
MCKIDENFSKAISVDVNISIYDSDYNNYSVSIDVTGLPEWLTLSGDLTSSDTVEGTMKYSYPLKLNGSCSEVYDASINVTAYCEISGDIPILMTSFDRDVNIKVVSAEDNKHEDSGNDDSKPDNDRKKEDNDNNKDDKHEDSGNNDSKPDNDRKKEDNDNNKDDKHEDSGNNDSKPDDDRKKEDNDNNKGDKNEDNRNNDSKPDDNDKSDNNSDSDNKPDDNNNRLPDNDNANYKTAIIIGDDPNADSRNFYDWFNSCSDEELAQVKTLEIIRDLTLENLTGLYRLVNLESLSIHECENLASIDLSGCEALISLDVCSNSLENLDVSPCVNLNILDCRFNSLGRLDLDMLKNLIKVSCSGQNITGWSADIKIDLTKYAGETNNIAYVMAGDSYGMIKTRYDSESGLAEFERVPVKIFYGYDTGFTNTIMDVTIYVIGDDDESYGYLGSSGGCDTGLVNYFWLLAIFFTICNKNSESPPFDEDSERIE